LITDSILLMRIDDYLSTVGLVKRRSVAKQLGNSGLIHVNGRAVKPAYQVKAGDIIGIRGIHPLQAEVIALPTGSVPKEHRGDYFRKLDR